MCLEYFGKGSWKPRPMMSKIMQAIGSSRCDFVWGREKERERGWIERMRRKKIQKKWKEQNVDLIGKSVVRSKHTETVTESTNKPGHCVEQLEMLPIFKRGTHTGKRLLQVTHSLCIQRSPSICKQVMDCLPFNSSYPKKENHTYAYADYDPHPGLILLQLLRKRRFL